MEKKTIDLYLGGDMGLWVLEQVTKEEVACIFTLDSQIMQSAMQHGFTVTMDNPNETDFEAAQIAFSVHYNRILTKRVLSKYQNAYNLHPGFLPWGKGYYPIFWALWEKTAAGGTLHEMTEQIDKGPIVAQTQVHFTEYETGHEVFLRVRDAEKELFKKYFKEIFDQNKLPTFPQPSGGTYHTKKEFLALKHLKNWSALDAESLIKLTRYLTFPSYTGLVISIDDQSYEICLQPTHVT